MKKNLFLKFILLVIISGALGFSTKTSFAAQAYLSFSPSSGTKTVGESFDIAIHLDTGSTQTDGTRAIINYDTTKLEVLDMKNGVYASYPTKKWEGGKITISGISALDGPYYSGSGTFATISFRAKSTGTASLSFDYTAGSTTDSNVAEHNTNADILTSVGTASFTISETQTGAPIDETTESLPYSATSTFTWLLALVGASLLAGGSSLLRRT